MHSTCSLPNRAVLPPVRSLARRTTSRSRVVTRCAKPVILPQTNVRVVAEKLNGRLAMLGFLAGSGYETITGMNYIDQAHETWPFVVFMSAAIGFATFKTRNLEVVEELPFTTNLELLNGRMAMMGILAKLVYDSNILQI